MYMSDMWTLHSFLLDMIDKYIWKTLKHLKTILLRIDFG